MQVEREKHNHVNQEAGFNISWGSIFAGVVTFIATLFTLGTISSAIGLGMVDFTSGNPFSGVGTGVTIWSVIALILSFIAAGFVSGIAARRLGLLHGFVTWAASVVIALILGAMLLSTLLSIAGSAIQTTANVAGDVVTAGASAAGSAVQSGFDTVQQGIQEANVDGDQVTDDVASILEDTGVEELQPEYIQTHLNEAGNDIQEAAQEVIVNPENADQIFQALAATLGQRAADVGEAADQDAIANVLQQNTDMTQAEANEAAANAAQGLEETAQNAEQALNNAADQLEQTQQELQGSIQELQSNVAQGATDATDTGSSASIWSFVGLLLSAIISTFSGMFGANLVKSSIREESA